MFYYSIPNRKLTLKHKIVLALGIVAGVVLLFLFGFTILVLALAGGLITFFVNLFQGKRKAAIHPTFNAPPYPPPFRQKRPPKMDDDDVIDI